LPQATVAAWPTRSPATAAAAATANDSTGLAFAAHSCQLRGVLLAEQQLVYPQESVHKCLVEVARLEAW
jgi:hypothetical protein